MRYTIPLYRRTSRRMIQISEYMQGYADGYITDEECLEMCDIIEGQILIK